MVKPGQIYKDMDGRREEAGFPARYIAISSIVGEYVNAMSCGPDGRGAGRTTRIHVSNFYPAGTGRKSGYVLVGEVTQPAPTGVR